MNTALAGASGKAHRIRLAALGDIDQLLQLEQRCFDGDRLSRRSFRRLLTSESAALLIAEHGYLLLLLRRNSQVARIYSVAVAPEARGRGLGRALVDCGERLARERGRTRMQLEVRVDNLAATTLYESLGYVAGERLAGYYEDGQAARRYRKSLIEAQS